MFIACLAFGGLLCGFQRDTRKDKCPPLEKVAAACQSNTRDGTCREKAGHCQTVNLERAGTRPALLSAVLPGGICFGKESLVSPSFTTLSVRQGAVGVRAEDLALCPSGGSQCLLSTSPDPFPGAALCAADILIRRCPKRRENHPVLACVTSSLPPSKVGEFFRRLFIEV